MMGIQEDQAEANGVRVQQVGMTCCEKEAWEVAKQKWDGAQPRTGSSGL